MSFAPPSSSAVPPLKRSHTPDTDTSRPTKRVNLEVEPPTPISAQSAFGSGGCSSDQTDSGLSVMASHEIDYPDRSDSGEDETEAAQVIRPRLDKGKGKAKPVKELPDTVWTRIFEHYYDLTCSNWDRDNTHRDNLTPVLLSREIGPIALKVLYRHPHLSYHHLEAFGNCVKYLQPNSDVPKTYLVRHLTIRASRHKPLTPLEGSNPAPAFYTINTYIKEVCSLFTDLSSFTIKDTLILHSADARLLFDSLSLLKPKKLRLEIRLWNLAESPFGREIIAASATNVHERYTDQVVFPVRAPTRGLNRAAISETSNMQAGWRVALTNGGVLHFPPWWIDAPRREQALPVPGPHNGQQSPVPNGTSTRGLRNALANLATQTHPDPAQSGLVPGNAGQGLGYHGPPPGIHGQGSGPVAHPPIPRLNHNLPHATRSTNRRAPSYLNTTRSGAMPPRASGIGTGPAVGESSTGAAVSLASDDQVSPPRDAAARNRVLADHPATSMTPPTRASYSALPFHDAEEDQLTWQRQTGTYGFAYALDIQPHGSFDRETILSDPKSLHQESTVDVTHQMPSLATAESATAYASTSKATSSTKIDDHHQRQSAILVQRCKVDHLFATDEDYEAHEGVSGEPNSTLPASSSFEAQSTGDTSSYSTQTASIPPPRLRLSQRSGLIKSDLKSEIEQQTVYDEGAGNTSFLLAHEMRGMLLGVLERLEGILKAFSFVALDPVATLIVRDPQLEFWVRVAVPHIRVHLARGINSLVVFKGAKENTADRVKATNRGSMSIVGDDGGELNVNHGLRSRWNMEQAEEEERIVGGDGHGGDLVNDSTRLFEIEVNTVEEMADERDWILRGEQLPSQACRILVGSSDWRDVHIGPMAFTPSFAGTGSETPPSPSSSQFQSPTFSFVDLEDTDDEMIGGDEGESYDRDAALEQKRRFEGRQGGT